MMTYNSGIIIMVTMLTAAPWGIALIIQKAENRGQSRALHLETKSLLVLLFGLSPGKEFVYVSPGIIQIGSIVYLVACIIAASLWGGDGVLKTTLYGYFGGIVLWSIYWWVAMLLKRK